MKEIKGKTAFITGAEKGLGKEIALVFAREGANVVIFGIDSENGSKTVKEIENLGVEAIFIKGNVVVADDIKNAIDISASKFGRIDFGINCAGIGNSFKSLHEFSEEEYDRLMGVDLKGVFLSMKYELEDMLKYNDGMIVNISSAVGLIGSKGIALYSTAKHGVIGMTKSAALDYAKTDIRINAICPGTMATPMILALPKEELEVYKAGHPIGKLVESSYIAENVVWLCSEASKYTTGSVFSVDGGYVAQ